MFGGEIMFQLANVFMRFMGSADFWQKWFGGEELSNPQITWLNNTYGWVETIYSAIMTILVPILAIVAAAGIVWAIVLGVQMARADSTEKREEAKKRLIGLVVGIVILVVLIVFFTTLFPTILKSVMGLSAEDIPTGV